VAVNGFTFDVFARVVVATVCVVAVMYSAVLVTNNRPLAMLVAFVAALVALWVVDT
jgi:hypothetical protein